MDKRIRIVVTGGGTAGHIFPLVSVVRESRRLHYTQDMDFFYIGPKDGMGIVELEQENIIVCTIAAGKIRRYFAFENIIDIIFKIPFSFIQSFFLLAHIKPSLVFSKGGTGSLAVTWCAWLLGIPVFLHESDIVPGLSNRITSKWAKKVFISFAKTEYFNLQKTILTGNPIKKELLEGNVETGLEMFNINSKKPVLMFMGGSQGSGPINDFMLLVLNDLLKDYEVIHISGRKNYGSLLKELPLILQKEFEPFYHLYESFNEIQLKHAYALVSLIISRAGSASIFEIAAAGKPSILIPLPSAAGDHQSKNAYDYARTGAALIIEQENLTPHFFIEKIHQLFIQPQKMDAMKEAALAFAKPLASKAIAREILEYLHAY